MKFTLAPEEIEELRSQIDDLEKAQEQVIERMKVLKNEQKERRKLLEAEFSYEIGNIVYQELGREVKTGDIERFRNFLKRYRDIFKVMMDIENDEVGVDITYKPTISESIVYCLSIAAEKKKCLTARQIAHMIKLSPVTVKKQLFMLISYGVVQKVDDDLYTITKG